MGTYSSEHDDTLDKAEDAIEAVIKGVLAETGADGPDAVDVVAAEFERRAMRRPRLREAIARAVAHEALTAYWITHGYEPVPGEPGKVRLRAAGPWSRAEQERLADQEGIPLSALGDPDE